MSIIAKATHPSRIQEILSWGAKSENYQQLLSILVEFPRYSNIPCLVYLASTNQTWPNDRREPCPLLQKPRQPSRIQEILNGWTMSGNHQQLLSIIVEFPRNSNIPCLVLLVSTNQTWPDDRQEPCPLLQKPRHPSRIQEVRVVPQTLA